MNGRVGFDRYTIGHRGLSARETLQFARARGLAGVQFLEPAAISPTLDRGALAEFADEAEAAGLYLEVGIPSPNPTRRARELGQSVTPVEHADDLARHAEAAAWLGCRQARAYVGDRHDRFRPDPTWAAQLDATRATLRRLTPTLRDLGLRVAIETHADLTSGELARLLEDLDPDAFGVTLDTGNLAMRLDDPLAAVERLAPRVLCTNVKDCVVAPTTRGGCWQARPLGEGLLPLGPMIATLLRANPDLRLSIELHPRTYDLPWADPTWLAFFPDDALETLPAVQALADEAAARNPGVARGGRGRPLAGTRPGLARSVRRVPAGPPGGPGQSVRIRPARCGDGPDHA
jgi:sugar phosphate isomerase/epimerase